MSAFWLSVVPRRHAHRMVMMVMAMGQRSHREHDIRAVALSLSICCRVGVAFAVSSEAPKGKHRCPYDFRSQAWSEWVTEAKVEFTEAKVERPGARRLAAFCSDMSTQDIYALEVDFP